MTTDVTMPTTGTNPAVATIENLERMVEGAVDVEMAARIAGDEALVVGSFYAGEWNPSTENEFPSERLNIGGAVRNGDFFSIAVAGTVDGVTFSRSTILRAYVDDPSTTTYADNWKKSSLSSEYPIALMRNPTLTSTGQTDFTLDNDLPVAMVFIDGVQQNFGTFTFDYPLLTFVEEVPSGSEVEVFYASGETAYALVTFDNIDNFYANDTISYGNTEIGTVITTRLEGYSWVVALSVLAQPLVTVNGVNYVGQSVMSLAQFGKIDTKANLKTAMARVIAYLNANGSTGSSGAETEGFTITIPNGYYDATDGFVGSIDVDNVTFEGQSSNSVIFKIKSNSVFTFGQGLASGRAHSPQLRNMKFIGDDCDVTSTIFNLHKTVFGNLKNIDLRDVGCVLRAGVSGTSLTTSVHCTNIQGHVANLGVATFDLVEGAGFTLDESTYIYTNIGTPTGTDPHEALDGQHFINCEGNWDTVQATGARCNRYYRPVNIDPDTSMNCNNWFLTSFVGDYNRMGIRLNSDGGNIRNVHFTDAWSFALDGNSITLEGGALGLLEHIYLTNAQCMLSGANGIEVTKGNHVHLTKPTTQGQGRLVSGSSGVLIGGTATNVTLDGGAQGLDAAATTPYTAQADYGVKTESTAKRLTIINQRADGAVAAFDIATPTAQAKASTIRDNFKADGGDPEYFAEHEGTITLPASGVDYTNETPFTIRYYLHGGAASNVKKNGQRVSTTTNVAVVLRPTETMNVTYSSVVSCRSELV